MKSLKNTPLPKSVTIFGERYKVKQKHPIYYTTENGSEMVNGLYDPNTRTIWVDSELPHIEKWVAFQHECNHAIADETGISQNLTHDQLHPFIENTARFSVKFFSKLS